MPATSGNNTTGPGDNAPATTINNNRAPVDYGMKCDAKAAETAIGLGATESVVEVVRAKANAYMVRIVRPGQFMTKDYNQRRLNLEVDAGGRIVGVSCG
jgi:hypothetical protein